MTTAMNEVNGSFAIEPEASAIGATVSGVDLANIDETMATAMHAALLEHHVLFFRDAHLRAAQMVAFAESLGTLGMRHHSYTSHPDHDDVTVLEWGGDKFPDAGEWHSDMTYRAAPPFASILQGIDVPEVGGDTLWASMFSVHDALPEGLRSDLAALEAVHDMGAFRTGAYRRGGNPGIDSAMVDAGSAVHPIIDHHPTTGRPYVNVSEAFTRFIVGMTGAESARVLDQIFDLIKSPEHQVRLRWRAGTVAIWDNYGTQHYACTDYFPNRRVMHRVVVAENARQPSV